ncbi:MAG: hypothetical protein AW09_000540 [Candidatus Accumulibacter phosphatis]|uniref:Uncharacterized protein n=1 Tax=Candidatus Accumulibacter phosphatis TaxID=327160 RepID=A0A080M1K6_9PROT|nr:MAG: hypothetical protein AW09_000540 [Candidatus Accumulibacter phosphatis]
MEGLAIAAEDRQRLVFGRGGEGEKAHVRLMAPLGHGEEQALQLNFAFLFCHLLRLAAQIRAAEYALEFRRRLARLRAVRLVDDHRVLARGQMALAAFAALLAQPGQLPGHERKLLQRGDDDRHAGFQRLGELARILVDLLHHALAVVELVNGVLQLTVQHHPVGDDHHAVEQPLVAFVVQAGQAVRQPGNRIALAAAGRMLDQIVMSHTFAGSGCHHLAHRLQLVIAREDQAFLANLPAVVGRLLLHIEMQKAGEQVEQAVALQDLFPHVRRLVVARIKVGRVAGSALHAPVEGQEVSG